VSDTELKTVAEVAAQLRLSDQAVYDLCRVGRLRHLRLGNSRGVIRIAQTDVEAYKDACVSGKTQPSGRYDSISAPTETQREADTPIQ
jgi:excisionase family DNA binding protein